MAKNKRKPSGKGKKGEPRIAVTKDGPYIVSGGLPLAKEIIISGRNAVALRWAKGDNYPLRQGYALCRCGQSAAKPYCSGMHAETGFKGTETSGSKKYARQAGKTSGPAIILTDAVRFCASARFCDRGAGAWEFTKDSGNPKSKKLAIREACDCPSGRLVVWDRKTGKPIEPKFKKSISIIEDPGAGVSGPIWVKGGVAVVSSDGKAYEVRNRVTLCRCGQSRNKPFCDGTHMQVGFNDGDKRLRNRR
jgi:CDGSH-type Zn-finger protein